MWQTVRVAESEASAKRPTKGNKDGTKKAKRVKKNKA
jgi:hypothetical protein